MKRVCLIVAVLISGCVYEPRTIAPSHFSTTPSPVDAGGASIFGERTYFIRLCKEVSDRSIDNLDCSKCRWNHLRLLNSDWSEITDLEFRKWLVERAKLLKIGMDNEKVLQIMGMPTKGNQSVTAFGEFVTWEYSNVQDLGGPTVFIDFSNGKVSSYHIM